MTKRILTIIVLLMAFAARTLAESGTAQQSILLNLLPIIEIANISGNNISLSFNTVSQYENGLNTGKQVFKVRSNKGFMVSVSADAPTFSYSGTGTSEKAMPVDNTLFLSLVENSTKGEIANGVHTDMPLSATAKDILVNCSRGDEQSFAVNYKAKPDLSYPAGNYQVGIIYTATQP